MTIPGLSVAIAATSEFFETVGNDLLAPWGGWQGFKSDVVCLFECSGPGDGSLGAQLAALGPIAAPVGEVNVVEEAAEGSTILLHGTDAASAADILANGINLGPATELGGGDLFWTTTSSSDAGWFAASNPAGGPAATLSITIPNSVIENPVVFRPPQRRRECLDFSTWCCRCFEQQRDFFIGEVI